MYDDWAPSGNEQLPCNCAHCHSQGYEEMQDDCLYWLRSVHG